MYPLYGALAGGPLQNDFWDDDRNNCKYIFIYYAIYKFIAFFNEFFINLY